MPNPLEPETVGIVVAVHEELCAVCRRLSAVSVGSAGGLTGYQGWLGCEPVTVAASGMGRERAARVAAALLAAHPLSMLVIAGFAAGLDLDAAPGDIVVASRVVSSSDGCCIEPDPALLAATARLVGEGTRAHCGPIVTVDKMGTTAADKAAIAEAFPGALAADMETAGAARAAEQSGVPWIAARAITDGLTDPFPLPFDCFVDADGEPDRPRIVLAALARPRVLPGLVRLGRRSALAAGNLAVFVEAAIRATRGETR